LRTLVTAALAALAICAAVLTDDVVRSRFEASLGWSYDYGLNLELDVRLTIGIGRDLLAAWS
jgi:hypothetical protein